MNIQKLTNYHKFAISATKITLGLRITAVARCVYGQVAATKITLGLRIIPAHSSSKQACLCR
jgi:hypothetical protein